MPNKGLSDFGHRTVLTFNVGRADVLRIGRAFDAVLADANAFSGAVAAFGAFRCGSIQLHKLRVVHIGPKAFLNRLKIRPMRVCRELDLWASPLGVALPPFAWTERVGADV